MERIRSYINLIRPKNWIKNLLVFSALLFAGKWTNISSIFQVILAYASFCLISSTFYILNDWLDQEKDRKHPTKKDRPIASGAISGFEALGLAVLFAILTVLVVSHLSPEPQWNFLGVLGMYSLLQILYNGFLKHLFGLDILAVSSGYVLRAIAGGVSIQVPITNWFMLTIFLLCFLLVTAKRRNDLNQLDREVAIEHRPVLQFYSVKLLDRFIIFSATAAFVTYCLYTVSETGGGEISAVGMPFSIFFVIFGLMRYLYLIYEQEVGGDPVLIFLRDIQLQICILSWTVFIGLLFYI